MGIESARVGFILFVCLFAFSSIAAEIEQVEVSALLGSKAMVSINGQKYLLAIGEVTPEGVELISVKADGIELKVAGKTAFYALGSSQIRSKYSRPEKLEERVYRDSSGMFRTAGTINGHMVSFLVDTGATTIAINSNEARRLGINYLLNGQSSAVQTASGVARAWAVKLDRVTVGRIELSNIAAVVIDGSSPLEVLLGMSFLERLDVQQRGEVMLLETKF